MSCSLVGLAGTVALAVAALADVQSQPADDRRAAVEAEFPDGVPPTPKPQVNSEMPIYRDEP